MGHFKDLKAWRESSRYKGIPEVPAYREGFAARNRGDSRLALALDYFRPDELAKVQATREECAKTVYGLLRKLSDGPKQPGR